MENRIRKNIIQALKIAVTAILAILLAQAAGLEFSVSAGIVAILSIAFTKKETLQTARNRFLAFLVALVIAAGCFNLMGYTVPAFFVYLALFILICQFMGWNNAMAMDSVLISHFLTFGEMTPATLLNEIALFLIGVGMGIIANLFLRRDLDYMARMKEETDDLIRQALHRMSLRIMDPAMPDYDGKCFGTLRASIEKASALAHLNYMNQITGKDREDMEYIAMRERQTDTLYEIFKHLRNIETVPVTAELLSEFFEKVSAQYSMDNTVEDLMDDFCRLDGKMKGMPLPVDRKEFEDRARLFAIMRGMEEFLRIKREYVEQQSAFDGKK